jgi:hypothetical protein
LEKKLGVVASGIFERLLVFLRGVLGNVVRGLWFFVVKLW